MKNKIQFTSHINVNCQVIYSERQPVFHIFLYFSYAVGENLRKNLSKVIKTINVKSKHQNL